MLTLSNEPDHQHAVALGRVFDESFTVPPIPAGAVVRIAGVVLDDAGCVVAWSVAWRGSCYWALPQELRPAHDREMILAFEPSH